MRKQILFKAGNMPEKCYFLLDGELELYQDFKLKLPNSSNKLSKYQSRSTKIILTILGSGEIVGEEELLKAIPYKCTCRCLSSMSRILSIDMQVFREIID
jgi:CRP-like cAMP-binding protein